MNLQFKAQTAGVGLEGQKDVVSILITHKPHNNRCLANGLGDPQTSALNQVYPKPGLGNRESGYPCHVHRSLVLRFWALGPVLGFGSSGFEV